jgi:uncharacterized protein (DUF362 family)
MSVIYSAKICDRKDFVTKTIKIFKTQIDQASNIFIKPNIVSSELYPTTTHPQILDTLLGHLTDREVIVGDGHAVDTWYTKDVIENSPLKEICSHHSVELVNLYDKKMKKWKSPRGYTLTISTLPLECDYVISLPVLKAHKQCGLSGALKNQFGYLSKLDRIFMHAKIKNIHKGIAEVNLACPTNLFIVDAVETLIKAQECRHGGCPAKLNTMLAGTDPVNLDAFGQKLLQKIDPSLEENVKHLNYAQQYGIGKKNHTIIKI